VRCCSLDSDAGTGTKIQGGCIVPKSVDGQTLAETISAVRRDLVRATELGDGDVMRFRLGPVELELMLEVQFDRARAGGVQVMVVSGDVRRSESRVASHKVKLTLLPETVAGGDVVIHGRIPTKPIA
jgi:hypothetical protein